MPMLRACGTAQGRLLGMLGAVGGDTEAQSSLDAMLQNIITSSAIEGEQLNVGSVRSSLAKRLGVVEQGQAIPLHVRRAWPNYCWTPPKPIDSR